MDRGARDVLEARLGELVDRGAYEDAVSAIIKGFGPELLGLLLGLLRGRSGDANDVFSLVCEDIWRGLPGFERRSSFRTWCFAIMRRALARTQRSGPWRRARLHLPLSVVSHVSKLQQRSRTNSFQSKYVGALDRVRQIRDALPADDQLLLMLRLDRDLGWLDVARVMLDSEDAAALERKAAQLRKRFQLLRDRLRRQAQREGLLGAGG